MSDGGKMGLGVGYDPVRREHGGVTTQIIRSAICKTTAGHHSSVPQTSIIRSDVRKTSEGRISVSLTSVKLPSQQLSSDQPEGASEPSTRSLHLEESVNESLVERFLRSGSSTSSFKCCERRLSSVTLTKDTNGSLGVMIAEGVDHGLYIQAITSGGPAHKGGQLRAGDRIVGINGLSVESFSYNRAVDMLRNAPPVVTLLVSQPVIVHTPTSSPSTNTPTHDNNTYFSDHSNVKSKNNAVNLSSDNPYPQTSTPNSEIQKNPHKSHLNLTRPKSLDLPLLNSSSLTMTDQDLVLPRQQPCLSGGVNYITHDVQPIQISKSADYNYESNRPHSLQLQDKIDMSSPRKLLTQDTQHSDQESSDAISHQQHKTSNPAVKRRPATGAENKGDVRSGHVTLVTLNTTQKRDLCSLDLLKGIRDF